MLLMIINLLDWFIFEIKKERYSKENKVASVHINVMYFLF